MIVFLLVSFKTFSQNDTQIIRDSVVVLSENQARKVIKDLIRYNNLKEINYNLEKRIEILKQKEQTFKDLIDSKDVIINSQQELIDTQEEILKKNKRFKINGYVGVQTISNSALIYASLNATIKELNFGIRPYIGPVVDSGVGVYVEYKIF